MYNITVPCNDIIPVRVNDRGPWQKAKNPQQNARVPPSFKNWS